MPGRVSKAIRKAVNETVRSLVNVNKGKDCSNPYPIGTRPHTLFARLYPRAQASYRYWDDLDDDMMYTMYGVLPDDLEKADRILKAKGL